VDLQGLIDTLKTQSQKRDLFLHSEEEDKGKLEDMVGGEFDYGVTMVPSSVVLPFLEELQSTRNKYSNKPANKE